MPEKFRQSTAAAKVEPCQRTGAHNNRELHELLCLLGQAFCLTAAQIVRIASPQAPVKALWRSDHHGRFIDCSKSQICNVSRLCWHATWTRQTKFEFETCSAPVRICGSLSQGAAVRQPTKLRDMDMAGIELTKARPDLDVLDSHEHLVVADSSFRGGSAYLDSLAEGPDEVGPPPQELGGSSNRNQSSSRRKRPTQQQGVPQDESAPPTRSQQPGDVEAPADSGAQQKPLIESGTSKCKRAVKSYFARWKGQGGEAPSIPPWHFLLLSFVGAYAGILAVAACDKFFYHFAHINLLIPSFGASAVILYCSPDSPLGTPRAFVGGYSMK